MQFFTDKMSDFCRKKNREVDELKKEKQHENEQKVKAMLSLEQIVKQGALREQTLL